MRHSEPVVANDSVVFYPSVAQLDDAEGVWRIPIAGHATGPISVNFSQRIQLRLLRQAMKAPPEAFNTPIFQQRIQGFLAPGHRGLNIGVKVSDVLTASLKKSCRNGRFVGELQLPSERIDALIEQGLVVDGWLNFEATTTDDRQFVGRTRLLEPTGLSIVSDIDDTIKHSGVCCRRLLLNSTFLRKFLAVSGMAPLYQQWEREGAAFHYVSSSPWQLYRPLANFCEEAGFPDGTFHLRAFRLSHQVLRKLFLRRGSAKLRVIDTLIQRFPQRRFLLVGDSGEHDPETYGILARRYPRQVSGILIRELSSRDMSLPRCRKAFRELSPQQYQVFRQPDEIHINNTEPANCGIAVPS